MIRLILVACLLLGGCAYVPGPSEFPEYETYNVQVNIHKDFESVNEAYSQPQKVWGFAKWDGNQCTMHYILNDEETFLHERNHCYYGNWHKPNEQRSR